MQQRRPWTEAGSKDVSHSDASFAKQQTTRRWVTCFSVVILIYAHRYDENRELRARFFQADRDSVLSAWANTTIPIH